MRKAIPYGRYLLLERIAIGGMAEVYLAARRDDPSPRLYAVKRILPTLAEDGELLQMFLDEARLAAQLDHPGIVPIHELGKHGEGYYIAMEYVPGRDLRALLSRARGLGERVPAPLAAYVGWRVADALDHAHRKRDVRGSPLQVVHRDVSPANVLLGFDGSVRVIDFGIAQAARDTRRDAALRGKFGYMSPEMAAGEALDRRSDVFALGVVLHELLTGARLFAPPAAVLGRFAARRCRLGAEPGGAARPDAVVPGAARDPGERFAWASPATRSLPHAGSRRAIRALARHGARVPGRARRARSAERLPHRPRIARTVRGDAESRSGLPSPGRCPRRLHPRVGASTQRRLATARAAAPPRRARRVALLAATSSDAAYRWRCDSLRRRLSRHAPPRRSSSTEAAPAAVAADGPAVALVPGRHRRAADLGAARLARRSRSLLARLPRCSGQLQ
jgi:hypothetical protein